ncbi:MAG: hypothetical protein B6I24_01075 [Bacteroidetes bacterium 4572_128]|nr:MAG: hypothetical protein B6I24_01075 [Bacteroidetes bacterium 4572_128]
MLDNNYLKLIHLKKVFLLDDINIKSTDWILGVIIFSLIILLIVKLFSKKYLIRIFSATHHYQSSYKLFYNENNLFTRISSILNILFIIIFSLFVYQIFEFFNFKKGLNNFQTYIIYFLILFVFYFSKILIYKILSHILMEKKLFSEYSFNIFLFNKVYGIFLISVVTFVSFSPIFFKKYFIYLGIITFILNFLFQTIRGIQISFNHKKLSLFYMILFFLSVEIIPFLLIYKYFEFL